MDDDMVARIARQRCGYEVADAVILVSPFAQVIDTITALANRLQALQDSLSGRAHMQMTRREKFWVALIWAGLIATVLLLYAAVPAEARHHHGGGCASGQILIRHSGRCVSKGSAAAREVYHPRRVSRADRREERRAAGKARLEARQATHDARAAGLNPALSYARVVEPEAESPPEVRCGTWEPSSVGWPIRWVRAQGLAQNGWRL